jgi:hypothetical protein
MSKGKKHNLPEPIGKQLKNKNQNPKPFDPTDDSGRNIATAFWEKHGKLLTEVAFLAEFFAANRDGNSLLLLDSALLGVCGKIRDHLSTAGVVVK